MTAVAAGCSPPRSSGSGSTSCWGSCTTITVSSGSTGGRDDRAAHRHGRRRRALDLRATLMPRGAPISDTLVCVLKGSKQARDDADARFRAWLVVAREHGVSCAELGRLLDMPDMTVWRWSGGAQTKQPPAPPSSQSGTMVRTENSPGSTVIDRGLNGGDNSDGTTV